MLECFHSPRGIRRFAERPVYYRPTQSACDFPRTGRRSGWLRLKARSPRHSAFERLNILAISCQFSSEWRERLPGSAYSSLRLPAEPGFVHRLG